MTISSVTSTDTTNASTFTSETLSNSSVLSSDFETFIKMLTTQAEYQDPLEPMDSSEYAAQLAQFSMVEQQVQSNDLLTALTAQLSGSTMGQLAGWIGMEARTTEPVLFDTDPITVLPTPPAGAQQMELVVYNNQGQEVDRNALSVSTDPVVWAGVGQSGQPLPAGFYHFEVEATGANGIELDSTKAETYARVVEVQNIGTEATVVFSGGSEALASSVTALREGS